MRKIALIVFCVFAVFGLYAQEADTATVVLTDGSTFRGVILDTTSTGHIRVRLENGSIRTCSSGQILRVENEQKVMPAREPSRHVFIIKGGWVSANLPKGATTAHVEWGYRITTQTVLGAGWGVENLPVGNLMMFYADVRSTSSTDTCAPYVLANLGICRGKSRGSGTWDGHGFVFGWGLGVRIPMSESAALHLEAMARVHSYTYEKRLSSEDPWYPREWTETTTESMIWVVVCMGISF